MEALTPFHLMFGSDLSSRSTIIHDDIPLCSSAQDCSKRVSYDKKLVQNAWNRFYDTYLNELRQHNLYLNGKLSKESAQLAVGDVVLIKGEGHMPRGQWKMGKIDKLVVGRDGAIRGAELSVISKGGQLTKASRPVQKLVRYHL